MHSHHIGSTMCCLLNLPEKLIEISVLHVLKDHDERVSIHTHTVELHYVFMLEVGQQLSLTLKILPGCKSGVLQGLEKERERESEREGYTLVAMEPPSCICPIVPSKFSL